MGRKRKEPAPDEPKIGHNSAMNKAEQTALRAYFLAHDGFDEQRGAISFERRELRKEMKERGYDVPAFDEARRRMRREDADRFYSTADSYASAFQALGALADMPLGKASLTREFGDDARNDQAPAGAS